jgi:hypothetical protein
LYAGQGLLELVGLVCDGRGELGELARPELLRRREGADRGEGARGAGVILRRGGDCREDVALGHLHHDAGLDVDLLRVLLEIDHAAALGLFLREDAVPGEKLDAGLGGELGDHLDRGAEAGQAPALGLAGHSSVAVAVEHDAAVGLVGFGDESALLGRHVGALLGGRLEAVGEAGEDVGDGGVEHHGRSRDGLRGADHAELELIAGEGEGARAVAVGQVLRQLGQGGGADLDLAALLGDVGLAFGRRVEDGGELVAEEYGDDRGGRLVAAEAEVVAGGGDGGAELGRVAVHRLDDGGRRRRGSARWRRDRSRARGG